MPFLYFGKILRGFMKYLVIIFTYRHISSSFTQDNEVCEMLCLVHFVLTAYKTPRTQRGHGESVRKQDMICFKSFSTATAGERFRAVNES